MDRIDEFDMPGGIAFEDITDSLKDISDNMALSSYMFMDGFMLQDAMSAIEIGEPRLDSGIVPEEPTPLFDPLVPLLPEEVCWILDRSFSAEVAWYDGNTLSQTVFTLKYVHSLGDIDPDFYVTREEEAPHPMELITVVLRAGVYGLLKSCDLAWRELSKGGLQDLEDWQAEKCEISLLEGVMAPFVIAKLDEATRWLTTTTKVSPYWQGVLLSRIMLRRNLVELMHLSVFKEPARFRTLLTSAQDQLRIIWETETREPREGSAALPAFDPIFGRLLNSLVPLRTLELPTPAQTWKSIEGILRGWEEIMRLSVTHHVRTWEVVGNIRSWMPRTYQRISLTRSLTQSTFYDGLLILDKHDPFWVVNRFFVETLGISYEKVAKEIRQRWPGPSAPPLGELEKMLTKLVPNYVKSLWYNPPRRRRYFTKSLLDWHLLYDLLCKISSQILVDDFSTDSLMSQLPAACLIWRLGIMREVVLSGFQLELYSSEERSFAYWYTVIIVEYHLCCLDDLELVIPRDSVAYSELQYQKSYLTALQAISVAVLSVSIKLLSFSWERMRLNFIRRYKWAFIPEYDEIETPAVADPDLTDFMPSCSQLLEDVNFSSSQSVKFAKTILVQLIQSGLIGCAGPWSNERTQVLQSLLTICESLSGLPEDTGSILKFDVGLLKWDVEVHPWFPILSEEGAATRRNRFHDRLKESEL